MIYKQDLQDLEVIVVDNKSSDHTVAVASRYPLARVIQIDTYLPGHALNKGIRASHGHCLSLGSLHSEGHRMVIDVAPQLRDRREVGWRLWPPVARELYRRRR